MQLFAAQDATWPAAETRALGPWTLRCGLGGGGRVSSATLDGPMGDIAAAEAAMRDMDQPPLFMIRPMIRPGEAALDAALAARGYALFNPTALLAAPVEALVQDRADWSAIRCSAPLAAMLEIWSATGVGTGRLAVMERAPAPKLWLFARDGDRPAGCAFVAVAGGIAMLHALAILPEARRRGLGARLTRAAAGWAAANGAATLALAAARSNTAAMALYAALGMAEIGGYHYRVAPEPVTSGR